MDPAHLHANRPFIERMVEDDSTAITRLSTATDEVASSLAAIEAAKKILEELQKRPELADWMLRTSLPDPEDAPPEPALQEPPSEPQPATDPPEPGEDMTRNQEDRRPTPEMPDPAPAADLRAAARAAANAASGEAGEHTRALRGWGLEPADLRVVDSLSERIDLARKLRTKRMWDLADLLGRMKNHRRAVEKRKLKANRDELYSVETGGDIARVLPSERATAFGSANPYRRLDFFRRLSERSVLSHSLRTEDPLGRGPVIAMVDSSYSMKGAPMQWASALSLALAQAASGGRRGSARRVNLIFFNTRVVLEIELEPGEKDVRKFLSAGSVEADGGTEYVPPITRALELLDTDSQPAADLLLVTDGLCELPEDYPERLAAEKARRGFKLVSVLVGEHASPGGLEPFSERIVTASDLAAASGARNAAGEVFESL